MKALVLNMSKTNSIIEPYVGFHFLVVFELTPLLPVDYKFKEVSGLSASITPEILIEGGENRFKHKLPTQPDYSNLVLKRGLFKDSGVINWCRDAIENFDFNPTNLYISLLNTNHIPVANWQVINAYPVKWSVSNFNAEENSLVIETIELAYKYFKPINL